MKRTFDIFLAISLGLILLIPAAVIAVFIKSTSQGPVLYWSKRAGKENNIFKMPKFRTMHVNTPTLATELLERPEESLTPIGGFLRRSSLDEIPQIWCILKNDMSFVGPRPALYNQRKLISLRTVSGVHKLMPGLTGLAQINGRDDLVLSQKVALDVKYLQCQSFILDIKIIFFTIIKVLRQDGVSH